MVAVLLATFPKRCATVLFSILAKSTVGEDPKSHLFPPLVRAVSLVDYQSTLREEKYRPVISDRSPGITQF